MGEPVHARKKHIQAEQRKAARTRPAHSRAGRGSLDRIPGGIKSSAMAIHKSTHHLFVLDVADAGLFAEIEVGLPAHCWPLNATRPRRVPRIRRMTSSRKLPADHKIGSVWDGQLGAAIPRQNYFAERARNARSLPRRIQTNSTKGGIDDLRTTGIHSAHTGGNCNQYLGA